MSVRLGTVWDDQSLAASVTSDAVEMQQCGAVAVELESNGGTHAGYIEVQVSASGSTWDSLELNDATLSNKTQIPLVSGTALVAVYPFDFGNRHDGGVRFVRLKYTSTSGTGTIVGRVL